MTLRDELEAAPLDPDSDSRSLYRALLAASVYVRVPAGERWAVTNAGNQTRAVPVFLTEADAHSFWGQATPEYPPEIASVPFIKVAADAQTVGGLVIDPLGPAVAVDSVHLRQLAAGEVPGEFAAWLRDFARLQRMPADVAARLRHAHVHVLTGRAADGTSRLYLLTKSEDGTTAVPVFSAAETLAQFATVRRLAETGESHGVALYSGAECLRIAAGLGAYVLVDPESPWETQVEPPLPSRLS